METPIEPLAVLNSEDLYLYLIYIWLSILTNKSNQVRTLSLEDQESCKGTLEGSVADTSPTSISIVCLLTEHLKASGPLINKQLSSILKQSQKEANREKWSTQIEQGTYVKISFNSKSYLPNKWIKLAVIPEQIQRLLDTATQNPRPII